MRLKPAGYVYERAYAAGPVSAPKTKWEKAWSLRHPDPGGTTWFIRNVRRCYVKVKC